MARRVCPYCGKKDIFQHVCTDPNGEMKFKPGDKIRFKNWDNQLNKIVLEDGVIDEIVRSYFRGYYITTDKRNCIAYDEYLEAR